jgi:hypothetical protein
VCLALSFPGSAHSQYTELETADLRLLYGPLAHGFVAPYAARCFENSMRFYGRTFGYAPKEKVTVILDDSYDWNNAAAFAAPRNTLLVQIAPANTVYETLPSNERLYHTLNHELGHIVALDQTARSDRFFRRIFAGKVSATPEQPESIVYGYLTQPRVAAPRWFHEGLAVFLETWMAGGIGRAQGAYDEMVFRSMVRDGSRFYDPLGLESEGTKTDFQVGALAYLYGARFMTYMAYQRSPEQLIEWASRCDGSKRYYASQFERVFGMSIGDAWKQWIEWERGFQQANLDSIRSYPLTPFQDLSARALGSVSRAFPGPDPATLYVALNYPGVLGHVGALSLADGSERKICDVKGPALYYVTSLAYDPGAQLLYYTADNNEWRDLDVVDPRSGETRRLIRDGRIGDLTFDRAGGALWGVRHFNGRSTLVRIPPPFTSWNQIHSWPYGQDIYDIDISPDGKRLAFSLSEISGRQSLQLAEVDSLLRGAATARELHDFGASLPSNFVFSPDGRYLYGSSYYTGVSNIWRYDLDAGKMDAVSNSETGFFRPLPLGGDSLIVFRYTGEGFVPARIQAQPLSDLGTITFLGQQVAAKHPVVTQWGVGSPAWVKLDSTTTVTGDYRPLRNTGLESVVPIVQGYKNYAAVGARLVFSDPAFWNEFMASLTYTPTTDLDADERVHASLRFKRRGWTLGARYNSADFYDLFGPTKTSRRGYAFGVGYDRNLIYDRPRTLDLHVSSTDYGNLETLPDAQNISAPFDQLWSTSAELRYRDVRRSLGAVDDEKGFQVEAIVAHSLTHSTNYPSLVGNFDFGFPLFHRHSSLWFRNSAGWAYGDRDDAFANFFFGGFGNNWVDHQNEKRYREYTSFPGVELNEIGGTNYAKVMVEWNLPPLRFRHVGTPAFFLTWVRPAIFAGGIATNLDAAGERKTASNLGAQLDLQFGLMSRLKMTFSVGYAAAVQQEEKRSDELLLSLKVL